MLNLKSRNFLLLFLLLFLSSCFQIIEEINLNDNGSGTVSLTLNLSASKAKVSSIMLMDSIQGYRVPTKQTIQKELEEVATYLKNSPGITNVQKRVDFENYIVNVSFAFKNISNINNVNQNVLKKLKIKAINNSSYSYDTKSKVFVRNYEHTREAVIQYNKLKQEVKNVFKDASYTSIYRFDNLILASNNPLAKVSKSKKAVMINTGILGLINGQTDISNKITLSN
jgi:hypothetical protein